MTQAGARLAEQREHDRFVLERAVVVDLSAGQTVEATLRNVSYGGLSLEAPLGELPLGADVEVCVPTGEGESVRLAGVVCWTRGACVGVRFEGLRRAARLAAYSLVEEARQAASG